MMHLIQTKKFLVAGTVVLGLASAQNASAFLGISFSPSSDAIATKLLSTMQSLGGKKFCQKGNTVAPFTIRSFEGILGKNKYFAAMGELICQPQNVSDFNASHFHANAVKTLGTSDIAQIRTIFVSEIRKAKSDALKVGCAVTKAGLLSTGAGAGAIPAVNTACGALMKTVTVPAAG
ncbi:MAG: hypothetical protein C0514_06375 [Candidatus Puniceispirillum sp.]|nr:hypothetical protein [Candidatus Puniceispirillum sp.]